MKYLIHNTTVLSAGFWPNPTNEIAAQAERLGVDPGEIQVIDTGPLEMGRLPTGERAGSLEELRHDGRGGLRLETAAEQATRLAAKQAEEDAEAEVQAELRRMAVERLQAAGKLDAKAALRLLGR